MAKAARTRSWDVVSSSRPVEAANQCDRQARRTPEPITRANAAITPT